MRASELIEALQRIVAAHGDLEVKLWSDGEPTYLGEPTVCRFAEHGLPRDTDPFTIVLD